MLGQLAQSFHLLALVTLGLQPCAAGNIQTTSQITPNIEARIVELFSNSQCNQVREIVEPFEIRSFRPNILAIAAACEPKGENSEELFKLAEQKNPTGDLILVLHARWLWKRDPKLAEPLWQKVRMIARTPYFKDMAEEYIAGTVDEYSERPLNLKSLTIYGNLELGSTRATDPRYFEIVDQKANSSYSLYQKANLNGQRWFRFGSISLNYFLTNSHYFSSNSFDQTLHQADAPIAIHIGPNEDVAFRPFASYMAIGQNPYQKMFGIGVLGVIYRSGFKHSVQGSVATDRIIPASQEALQGTHYKFEYSWDFFPPLWYFQGSLWIEHVNSKDDVINGITNTIPYSHTDLGSRINAQHDFRLFSLGLDSKVYFRIDADTSSFVNQSRSLTNIRRRDVGLSLQPVLTVPLFPFVKTIVWYQWDRILSNIGSNDYANRNLMNQVVGVGLRTSVSNY